MIYEPTNIENKIAEKLKVPPTIAEEIVASLEKKGIIEDDRLDIILPTLAASLQISKPAEGGYKTVLMDGNQKILMHDDTPWTIENWIDDYVFPESNSTISYEDSLNPTPEQVADIASGKLKVLPKRIQKVDKESISASELQERSQRNEVSVEDVASGKTKVDISK